MARLLVRRVLLGGAGFCLISSMGWGQEAVGQWSRGETGPPVPFWMSPGWWTEQAGLEIWRTEIRPTGRGDGMLLSVVFCSEPGGFVRVIWKSLAESVTLCADLTEGNLRRHQRSLFLDASRLAQPGQVWIEAKGAVLEKVRLERVDGLGWGSARKGEFVQTASGRLLRAEDLYGDAFRPVAAEKVLGVVESMLHPGPIAIQERSARLHVPLAETVDYARLEFWVAGLPADEGLLFSLNEAPFEELLPEVPALEDPGYRYDREAGRIQLAGWRHVVRFLPGSRLRKGANTFWFGAGGIPGSGEVAIRDLRLQAVFAAKSKPAAVVAPENLPRSQKPAELSPQANAGLSFRAEGVVLRP